MTRLMSAKDQCIDVDVCKQDKLGDKAISLIPFNPIFSSSNLSSFSEQNMRKVQKYQFCYTDMDGGAAAAGLAVASRAMVGSAAPSLGNCGGDKAIILWNSMSRRHDVAHGEEDNEADLIEWHDELIDIPGDGS
ncbi:hypothetical protein QYE76_035133 [Lolium multiflorum]|uniref:Uncharacterized protein n=1 Tax=Lolium multiflorum TaxID=4521 RepID=A0AAD8QYG0_LOLMU|nr:hypothetical protein QYE76_035133 [Lolium multiflorum]